MPFFLEILLYQLILFFLIPLYYLIGTIAASALCIKNNNDNAEFPFNFYLDIFYKTFTGIIIITVFAALFFTGGKTILSGFLLVIIFFIYENKWLLNKKFSIKFFQPISLNTIIRIIIFAELFFLFSCVKICDFYNLCFVPGYTDYIFLSKLSESLVLTGVENYFTGEKILAPLEYNYTIPYHYFDLWFNGIISKLFNTNNYITHELVTNNILLLISFIGLFALFNEFSVKLYKTSSIILFSILILLLMNIGIIRLPIYEKVFYLVSMPYKIRYLGENWMYFPKLIQIIPFSILVIFFIFRNQIINSILILLGISFIYQSIVPVLFLASFLFILFCYIKKFIDITVLKKATLYLVLIGIYFYVFYHLTGNSGLIKNDLKDFYKYYNIIFSRFSNTFFPGICQFLVYNIPWIALLVLLKSKYIDQFKKELIQKLQGLIICLVIGGFFCWLLFILNPDAPQFLGNTLIIALYLLIAVFLIYIIDFIEAPKMNYRKYVEYVGIASIIVLLLYRTLPWIATSTRNFTVKDRKYSQKYRTQIKEIEHIITNPAGVYIASSDEYQQHLNLAATISFADNKSDVLAFYPNMLNTINLGVFSIPLPDNTLSRQQQVYANKQNIFYKFVQNQKQENKFISIEKSQVDFIKYYNIQYLICTKNTVLHPSLELLIKSKAIDDNSGEIFCLLNI